MIKIQEEYNFTRNPFRDDALKVLYCTFCTSDLHLCGRLIDLHFYMARTSFFIFVFFFAHTLAKTIVIISMSDRAQCRRSFYSLTKTLGNAITLSLARTHARSTIRID